MQSRINTRMGFTLIELMAVVLILAILAGVALPRFFNYQNEAREAATKGTLGGVRAGVANFYANGAVTTGTAVYPTLTELTNGSTMQEDIPVNPYNDSADVESVAVRKRTTASDGIGPLRVSSAAPGDWTVWPRSRRGGSLRRGPRSSGRPRVVWAPRSRGGIQASFGHDICDSKLPALLFRQPEDLCLLRLPP